MAKKLTKKPTQLQSYITVPNLPGKPEMKLLSETYVTNNLVEENKPFITEYNCSIIMSMANHTSNSLIHSP